MRNPRKTRLLLLLSCLSLTLASCNPFAEASSSSSQPMASSNQPAASSQPSTTPSSSSSEYSEPTPSSEPVSSSESSEPDNPPNMSDYSFSGIDDGDGSYEYPDNSEGSSGREPTSTSYPSESDDPIPSHSYPETDPFPSSPSSSSSSSASSESSEPTPVTPANVRYALTDLPTGAKLGDYYTVTDTAYYSSLATDLACNEISTLGFEVFPAYAVQPKENEDDEDVLIPGLAFTSWTLYDVVEETPVYSCGFMQIFAKGEEIELLLVGEDEQLDDGLNPKATLSVSQGVFVYPEENNGGRFVIESNAFLDGFSGVYQGHFFSYKQRSAFSIELDVHRAEGELEDYADEDLDLYDYDHGEYLYKASLFREKSGLGAYAIYGQKASVAYDKAVQLLDEAIKLQEKNGWNIGLNSFVVFSEDVLANECLRLQNEAIQGRLASVLRNQILSENQYLVVSYNEEIDDFNITIATDPNYLSKQEHVANGLLKSLTAMLMIAGGVTAVILTAGALGPVALGVFSVTLTVAMAYAGSELLEGITEAYTGQEGYNPIKDGLKKAFGDEVGEKIYHTVGILSNLALTFFAPVSTALSQSFQAGYGLRAVAHTALIAAKEIVLHAAKIMITSAVAKKVAQLSENIAKKLGASDLGAKLIGFGSGLIAGALVYKGLSKIQQSIHQAYQAKVQNVSQREISQARIEVRKSGDLKYGDAVKDLYKQRQYYSRSALVRDYANNMTVELNLDNPVQLQYVSSQYDYLSPFMARNPKMAEKLAAPGGTYDPYTNTIYLFAEKMGDNGVETLRTLAHLMRHAYQFAHAEFDSPVMKGLREGAYEEYSQFDPSRQNPAEVDAENYANYIVERAYNAYDEWVKNPDIVKVVNKKSFPDPITFYEVNPA